MGFQKKESFLLLAILTVGLYTAGCGPSAGNTPKSQFSKNGLPIKSAERNSSTPSSSSNQQESPSESIDQALSESLKRDLNDHQVYEYKIFNNDLITENTSDRSQVEHPTPIISIDTDTTLAGIRKGERSLAIGYSAEKIHSLILEYKTLKSQGAQPTLKITVELFPNSTAFNSRREFYPKPTIMIPLEHNASDLSLHFLNAPQKPQSQTMFGILKEVRRIFIEII